MKKILIICDYFAPHNQVASIRPTKIAKFLKKDGFKVDVLTRELSDNDDRDPAMLKGTGDIDNIFRIADSGLVKWNNALVRKARQKRASAKLVPQKVQPATKPSVSSRFLRYLSGTLKKILIILLGQSFARRSLTTLHKLGNEEVYDVVFSTYGEFSGHLAALKYKTKHPEVLWIADFRDAVIQEETGFFWNLYAQRFQNKILKKADIISAVSEGVLDSLRVGNKPSYVLTNGYDCDDLPTIQNIESLASDDKFTLSYCGDVYHGKSDFSLFFQALSELSMEGRLSLEFVCIEYAGKVSQEFMRQAANHRMESVVKCHGFIPREESLKLQARSHALLLASWNKVGSTGILTGKLFEQMLMHKPIICIVSGDLPNSALKKMVEEGKLGICCEHACGETDYLRLKEYIFTIYDQYRTNGNIQHQPDEDYIARFDYANITGELERIF